MNKIFKVVWSKSKECYVVVSEVAKNNGGKKKVLASVLAGLAMVGVAAQMGTPVQAGANNSGNAVNLWADKKLDGSNNTANTVGANSVAVGNNLVAGSASTTPTGRLGGTAIAIGVDSQAKDDRDIAIGYNNTTEGQDSFALGSNVIAGTGQSIAIGSTNVDATTGVQTQTIARGKVTMKNGRPEPAAAIAIGAGAQAINGSGVLAMGQLAYASANNTVAIGTQTQAKADNSTAIGSTAQALSNSSAAFGTQAVANGLGATAVGPKAYAGDGSTRADGATAIGRASNASSKGSTSIGWANRSSAENATSIGFSATASGKQAVAIGGGDEYDPIKKDNSGAIISGTDLAKNYTTASGEHSVAIGSYAKATTNNSLAFGKNATANIENGVALGSDSVTTAAAGIAGYNPADSRTNKYSDQAGAVGTSTLAAVSVGNGLTATRQITGVAAGTADTDAVNVAQLKNVNLKYAGDTGNSDVLLKDGTLKVKGDTNFISTSADTTGITVTAKIGDPITANTDGKAVAPTTNGLATTTNVADAINASGWKVTSLNNGGTTNGTTSEKVSPGDTVTFSAGKNIVLDQAGKQFTYSLSSTLKDIQSIQNGASKITLNNAGGTTISGGNLSVDGNKITKVAQGTDGTDAVNVDQLNAVAAKERHVKPGNYAVDGNGTVTLNYVDGNNADVADTAVISGIAKDDLSNITNAGKKVITGLGSKVEAGDNVTVTDTTDATTGQKTYTVSANLTKVTDGTNTTVTGAGTTANPYKVNVAGDLTGITSIANTAGGPTMTIGGNSINVTGGNLDLGSNKITNLAPGTNDTDAVNYKQLKAAKTVVEAGTNVTVAKTTGANGEDVYTVSSSATGGTASTESVVKKAAAAGDTNIADVSVAGGKNVNDPGAQYEVSVSKNAVKDAAREAVTVNNGGNTDNPITVTPTDDAANHTTTYAVTFDGNKAAKQIPLTYKANGSGDKTVKLDKGLDFTNGTNTTAEIGNDGVVKFNLKDTVALTSAGSLTVGDTKVNNDGLTISGGPSVTKNGIDAGNQKITNVAPGTISSTSTDAVNGSQLYDVDQKFNNTVKLTGNAGATDGQALNKANGLSFGVIGANNGKYISTSANGSDVTVDLSTDAKKLLNNTVEVKGKNAATVTTSTETTADGGTKTIYTVDVASTGTVAKSSWNIASDKVSATEGTVATGSGAAQNIADTKTVTMQAGKNLTVNQTNDNGNASVAFALDKDLKDLASVTTDKVTTKEIGLQDAAGNTTTIKKDGDRITYTKDGDTKVHKVATLDDEKHIKPGSYAVQNDGSVTMTYVDGNGDPVANDEAKITGIAKQDLSNITDAGKNVITGLGTIVKAGDNVTVSEASDATTGQKTYTVNAVTPAVYTKADGTKVVKRPDGTFTTNVDGAPGNDVPASDVIVSIQDAAGNTIGGNSIVNNVGSAIDKTGTSTGNTFLNKLDTAANDTPNAAVNVKDLKNTSDAIIGKGLKFDANDGGEKTNKLGSKVTVKGEGTKANTEYSGTNIKTIIAQTGDDTTIDVKLAKDLTGINSISNTAAGPKMEFGGNSINVTGGNLDLGSNKITNLGPATSGSDAVNYDQLKNSRTEVKSSDGSVTVTPTTAGDKTTYDLKVATTGTVAKSTWNIASDKVSATEGTVAAGSGAAQNIADTKTVTMQAGKNLTVNQTNDNGNASVAFALDKDLKDLASVTTDKVTTKEIGLQDAAGNTTTIKKDGDRITYTKDGDTKVHKVATLDDEKHIKPGSYAVQNDGSVTMTYVDGNGDPVANDEAKITGIAKQDLSNITDAGKNVITGLGTIVKAGDNVTVSEASDATTGQKTYTVNAVTPAVYTKADGTKVVKRPDGTFTTNVDGAPGNDVPASDVIVSIQDAAGNTIGGNSIVNNVGSAIDKTGTSTGNTFLTNLNNAATDNPFAAVNVRDLKSTADALKASELHIAPTSVATGSTEVVGGTASGNTNPGAATQAYKYNATTKQVELTFNDGNGKAVNGPKAVIDFSDLNTGGTAASSWNIKSSANTTDGGAIGDNHDAAAQNIADNKTVEFQAGKNLVVKQTNDAANGNATVEFSLSDNITAGKDGANGKDGSVGATGKDGSSVVLNGKDGSIGMTGPKGQDGKDGINGRDGADISITSAKGEQVLVNRDPAHNGDTDKAERIVYVPKDANGNPIQGADGKNIVREVATMDDGLRFTGNNTSTENKQKLGSLVKVEGEGVTEAQANSFQSATGNIAVVADGADKLTVKLNKDLKGLDSVTTKEVKLGDANDNISIKKAGDRITYTTPGSTDTHKVATLDDEMHIKDTTYTVDGNKKVTMTYVDGNGNPVAGKTAVIDLSGLPVGETDTDMRIKEGNYTATNGSVTLNTVDKAGNPVTGKDVVIKGINTNSYQAGDNVTFTNNGTDANGNPIVKINAEVSTEQVVAKAGNDNLATVAPATGSTQGGKNATYEVNVDKTNLENKAEISYKANGGTAQKTTLANGFNFTSDDNSVAITTGANGKVNFKVDTTGIQGKAFNLDVNKEGTGKVENAQTAAATPSVEKGTKFVAGNNLSIRHDGINGDAKYDHQVTYALNSDLQGITSITNNGGATMKFGPNEVSITGGNLNMGGSKITNVKNGTDKSDVATVGQLTKVTSNDNTVAINKTTDADGAPVYDLSVQGGGHDPRVDQLGEEIGRVGAQGAALAALKPIQYDPLEPTQIMAGYGNYRGNSAIAMGVAHYKNESTLMHAGVSWAGGSRHMMANAGVTWKVGNRDSEAAVADRYRKGPISSAYAMQQEMASVKAQNAGLKTEVSDLKAENEQMKAQIAAMMAKLGM